MIKQVEMNHGQAGFDSWSRKHGRLLTIVGALIVFLTFIVNEIVRESLKDLVSQVETARSVFAIREENGQTRRMLSSMQTTLFDDAMARSKANPELTAINMDTELMGVETTELQASIDGISDLVENLKDTKVKEDLAKLKHEFEPVRDVSIGNGTSLDVLTKIVREFQPLETRTQNLEVSALKEASKERAAVEDRYKFWTLASYALYMVGWGLAFMGRLSGREGAVNED